MSAVKIPCVVCNRRAKRLCEVCKKHFCLAHHHSHAIVKDHQDKGF